MDLLFIAEMCGTISAAASGVLTAVESKYDIFGVTVIAIITATGGGLLRDVLLNTLPIMLTMPIYTLIAVITAAVTMIYCHKAHSASLHGHKNAELIFNIMDTVGLAMFTMAGVNRAESAGFGHLAFLSVFVGAVTGIGGGILRDVLTGNRPAVFRKHVYAIASISGALVYYYAKHLVGGNWAMVAGSAVIMSLRFCAIHFKWNVPRVIEDKQGEKAG